MEQSDVVDDPPKLDDLIVSNRWAIESILFDYSGRTAKDISCSEEVAMAFVLPQRWSDR